MRKMSAISRAGSHGRTEPERKGETLVGKNFEVIAEGPIDQAAHLVVAISDVAHLGQRLQEGFPACGIAPDRARLVLILQ